MTIYSGFAPRTHDHLQDVVELIEGIARQHRAEKASSIHGVASRSEKQDDITVVIMFIVSRLS
jgi:hypothetical protein